MDAPFLLSTRAWSFALLAASVLVVPVQAAAQPNTGLVYLGRSNAVQAEVENAMKDAFLLAPSATNAELTRNWGKQSGVRLKQRALAQKGVVFDLADASGVDLIIVADIEMKGRRRRQKPVRLHLAAVRVDNKQLLVTERLSLRVRGRSRRRTVSVSKPQAIRAFFARAIRIFEGKDDVAPTVASNDDVSTDTEEPSPPPTQASAGSTPTTSETVGQPGLRQRIPNISRQDWTRAGRVASIEAFGLARGRSFTYTDTLSQNLREFESGVSFGAGFRAEVYPLIFERESGTTRRVGLVGGYAQDFGIAPSVADVPDVSLTHTWSDWFAGAAVAWDFNAILVKATLTFGQYDATFAAPE
ncbi:MAG: hypothetical protein AAF658_09750, partial [Myxococcota bacterium]